MKNVADIYPLTPMQELMLVHALAARGADVLVNPAIFDLRGELDARVFQAAWAAVIARHPALRTAFAWEGLRRPMQVVRETVEAEWRTDDWRGQSPVEQEAAWAAWMDADARRGFTLTQAPLMRFALAQLGDHSWRFAWISHHLILDRWCIDIVLGELRACYEALLLNQDPALPPAPPFKAVVAWMQRRDPAQAETFWQEALNGAGALPAIAGGPDPARRPGDFAIATNRLPAATVEAVRGAARSHGSLASTFYTGAAAIVRAALAGCDDVIVGLTVSGRDPEIPGVERLVGSLINDLPVRVSLDRAQCVGAWARSLQRHVTEIQGVAPVAPARLLAWSERPGGQPLFDLLTLVQPAVTFATEWGALTWHPLPAAPRADVPLTLTISDGGAEVEVALLYATERFSARDAGDLLARYARVLAALAQPEATLGVALAAAGEPRAVAARPHDLEGRVNVDGLVELNLAHNGAEARVARLWGQVLGRANVPVDVDFFELGGTSLGAMQVLALAEREFGKPVPLATLIEAPTIAAFAHRLITDEATPWRALVPLQTTGTRTPFFGVHHGGGGVYGYADLARRLGPDQPVYAFQEPGYEPGSTPLDSIEALAELYLDELRSVQARGPYRLGGFCFGGVIAFEMARRLAAAGEVVDVLALIDADNPNPVPRPDVQARVGQHRQRLAGLGLAGRGAYIARWVARRAAWEIQRRYLGARHHTLLATNWAYRRLGRPVPAYIRQYALLQWNGRLQGRYHAGDYPGAVTLIRGAYPDLRLEHDFGWSRLAHGGVAVHQIPGEHLDLMNGPNIQNVVDVLAPLLSAGVASIPEIA